MSKCLTCDNCIYFEGWIDDIYGECSKYIGICVEVDDADNCDHYIDDTEEY